jgi:hypothetical protein
MAQQQQQQQQLGVVLQVCQGVGVRDMPPCCGEAVEGAHRWHMALQGTLQQHKRAKA